MEIFKLYTLIEENGIMLDRMRLIANPSISIKTSKSEYIALDHTLSGSEEKVALAHELGHCQTGSFYNIYSTLDIRSKHEHRANKWAIKRLVPKNELKKACKRCTNRWELSEHFGVTEEFMQKALDYYSQW